MSNSGSLEILNVSPNETSWLTTSLASLRSASRAMLLGATALASAVASNPVSAQPAQQHPNILVIMGDDVGWFNIGAYHRGIMSGKTPNLDKLASQGMLFTDYYAEAAMGCHRQTEDRG
jgi:hypothetical protein